MPPLADPSSIRSRPASVVLGELAIAGGRYVLLSVLARTLFPASVAMTERTKRIADVSDWSRSTRGHKKTRKSERLHGVYCTRFVSPTRPSAGGSTAFRAKLTQVRGRSDSETRHPSASRKKWLSGPSAN